LCAAGRRRLVPVDFLVLAAGVVPAFAQVPGAARYAIRLKAITDATRFRNQLLHSFESAAAKPERSSPRDTSVAVVGGGPTGIELSGYIASYLFHHRFTADYPSWTAPRCASP
jgi:NADH dehydrogenase